MPRRPRRLDLSVERQIAALAASGCSAPAIHRELERLDRAGELGGRLPGLRTVQRRLDDMAPHDPSDPWTFGEMDGEDARLVLDALAAAVNRTDGRIRAVSKAEADLIVKVARAAPDLPAAYQWRIARMYAARRSNAAPTDDLDALLAFAPWRDNPDNPAERYRRAVNEGWIVEAPETILGSLAGRWGMDDGDSWLWVFETNIMGDYDKYGQINTARRQRQGSVGVGASHVPRAGEGVSG